MIAGRQLGSLMGGHDAAPVMGDGAQHYRHDVETMKGFWRHVEEATQSHWKVEAGLYMGEEIERTKRVWADDNTRTIWWCATRQ